MVTSALTDADRKRFRLMGITKAAREPMFHRQARKRTHGNFAEHICWVCGTAVPCELESCNHAVCVRIMPCCRGAETAARMK